MSHQDGTLGFQQIAGIVALVLFFFDSFGATFSHYYGTQKWGGPRISSYTTSFRRGHKRLLDGRNASFSVCHLTFFFLYISFNYSTYFAKNKS